MPLVPSHHATARAPRRRLWIPLALLAASDVVLTTLVYKYPFSWDHFVTWAWYAGVLWLGSTIKRDSGAVRILSSALAVSISFFVISNFAVWGDFGRVGVDGDADGFAHDAQLLNGGGTL